MAAAAVANGNVIAGDSPPAPVSGRFSAVYSELQRSRIDHALPLPRVLTGNFRSSTAKKALPPAIQGGFDMICSGRDKIETPEQFKQAEETSLKLDLDGLVVIGGDDSNTNACLLAENFRSKNMKTHVIGCPKTIDGDLKCKEVPASFGFDTACKIYAEMIGNVMVDARSTGSTITLFVSWVVQPHTLPWSVLC